MGIRRHRPFVILTTQRTGSTWLNYLLDAHPEIACFNELFNPGEGDLHVPRYDKFLAASRKERLRRGVSDHWSIRAYFRRCFQGSHGSVEGFKLMENQLSPAIWSEIERRKFKVIVLNRENIVKTVVSLRLAGETKKWHRFKNQTKPPQARIQLDPMLLFEQVGRIERIYQVWDDRCRNVEHIRTSYESLCDPHRREQEILGLMEFLGVDPRAELGCEMEKLNSDRLQDILINYDEVRQYLRNTAYASMMDE